MVAHHRFLRPLLGILVVGLVAACSSAAAPTGAPQAPLVTLPPASSSPTTAVAASSTLAPSLTPDPTAKPKPSPTATPRRTSTPTKAPTSTKKPAASSSTASGPDNLPTSGRVTLTDQGFAITLPKGWQRISLDGSDIDQIANALPADSELGQFLSSQVGRAALAGIKLWAFDLRPASIADGYISNVNAAVQPTSAITGLTLFRQFLVAQLNAITGVSDVVSEIVKLPSGQALRTTYHMVIALPSGSSVDVAGTQFVLIGTDHTYAITFTCPAAGSSCADDADAAMKTFAYV